MTTEDKIDNMEEPIIDEQQKNYKKKIRLIIIVSGSLALILIITLILIFSLKDNGEQEQEKEKDNDYKRYDDIHIYIDPTDTYKYCIIWLHGLDNCPENYVDLFTKQNISIPFPNNTRIILMRAPKMNVTYNHEVVTSWFDILSFPINSTESYNFEDAKISSNSIREVVEQEVKLLNGHYENIFVGGHSQGACISLLNGYNSIYRLGGIIVCSGILFPETEIIGDKSSLNVFLGHGDGDRAIPFSFHKETVKRIENNPGVRKYYYQGHGHSISQQEKKDISAFLHEIMK